MHSSIFARSLSTAVYKTDFADVYNKLMKLDLFKSGWLYSVLVFELFYLTLSDSSKKLAKLIGTWNTILNRFTTQLRDRLSRI